MFGARTSRPGGDEIATIAAHIHAATHRLLELIAEFDRRRGWELGGHRSCAHWLSFRTGIDLGAAREKVRAARALVDLPQTSASMARGELSFSKVRALTRVADADNERDLLEVARGCTTAQLERVVRAWKRGDRQAEAERERARYERRGLSVFPGDDGMYVVRGRLTPEVGALLMRAVEAASDALFRAEDSEAAGGPKAAAAMQAAHERADAPAASSGRRPERDSRRAARRRRADALGLLAERAMAAGFGGAEGGEEAPVSGTRAERYQVMLHVDADTLDAEAEPGRSELEDGTRVSAENVPEARLRCRAGPDHARAGRFPAGRRSPHADHPCVLLCTFHHRLVHEGGWQVDWWGEGRPVFFDPRGGTHFEGRWSPPALARFS